MDAFVRLFLSEILKLRRSMAARMAWLLPVLFLAVVFLVFERSFLGRPSLSGAALTAYEVAQVKVTTALWGGLFHPLALGLLAGLLFRPEHRCRMWRHLHVQPVSRRLAFGAKALLAMALVAAMLILVWAGLGLMRWALGVYNPALAVPFRGWDLARLLGWLWLGSLPVLAFYLWISDRISTLAVPVVFGLVGLLLTVAFSAQENAKPWRRDMIPWVTPYFSAQWVMLEVTGKQEAHMGARVFQDEPNVLRLPSGKKVKSWQNVPDEVLFPPIPPTPKGLLAGYALVAGLLLFGLGWVDAGRNRA